LPQRSFRNPFPSRIRPQWGQLCRERADYSASLQAPLDYLDLLVSWSFSEFGTVKVAPRPFLIHFPVRHVWPPL